MSLLLGQPRESAREDHPTVADHLSGADVDALVAFIYAVYIRSQDAK
jgi:hypothetical protein